MNQFSMTRGVVVGLLGMVLLVPAAWSAQKMFVGGGDGVSWSDENNWFSTGVPGPEDVINISTQDAAVVIEDDFEIKQASLGGKHPSELTIEPFVYGEITPENNTDYAVITRDSGCVIFQGSGIVTLKGSLLFSDELIPTENSVMIHLQ